MRFRRTRKAAAADALHDALTTGIPTTPEHEQMIRLAAALRPAQPLSEIRRAETKAAMLRAASLPDVPLTADAGSMDRDTNAPLVHVREVVIGEQVVRVADVEPIDIAQALSAARKVTGNMQTFTGSRDDL